MTKGGCHESTRSTDGSGGDSLASRLLHKPTEHRTAKAKLRRRRRLLPKARRALRGPAIVPVPFAFGIERGGLWSGSCARGFVFNRIRSADNASLKYGRNFSPDYRRGTRMSLVEAAPGRISGISAAHLGRGHTIAKK
jgi:hypothetical protein